MKSNPPGESGHGIVEYGLILVLLIVIFVFALVLLGPSLRDFLSLLMERLAPA